MLLVDNPRVRKALLTGNFGLEKESLRVDQEGFLAHTVHPFPDDDHIVRDFCENQTEINTGIHPTPDEAVEELWYHTKRIQRGLAALEPREYLWPFSNPSHIRNEEDVPVARFEGGKASKTQYRYYLSDRYGRYKMTFSGIHFNFSFSDTLIEEGFEASGMQDFREFKDELYVSLAEKMSAYGWILVAISAASPLIDASYVEKGVYNEDEFLGMASVRCSELGYWNYFAPILDYNGTREYADSIQKYVDMGLISAPTEFYYPIRLKPKGLNNLNTLREKGVNHIELRMFDLNPLLPWGVEVRDLKFAHLMMVWLASTPRQVFTPRDQVQAIANFKNAAHYDLKTVKIVVPNGEVYPVTQAALNVIGFMRDFYQQYFGDRIEELEEIRRILDFEAAKFIDGDNRYAWQILKEFRGDFVGKGLKLAKQRQEEVNV